MRALLDLQLARDLHQDSGLSEADYDVLSTLSEQPGDQWRARDLAARLLWSTSRLAHQVGRMEQRGLVERQPAPGDARGALVGLTEPGRAALRAAAPPHVASVRRHMIDLLTDDEVAALDAIADKVIRRLADPSPRVVRASREIAAEPGRIFELIADPARQPRWDGNENLGQAASGQRVHGVGDVFTMTLRRGAVRENHVVEFDEGRLIAWNPSEPGQPPPGHLWRWELEPAGPGRTLVTHTYDWTRLTDEGRLPRARATTAGRLQASLDLLAGLAEA
jgi:DNA-binding MarR family transcriptional regulator/uncharacterized protein YndB with AHSA1/START domain